MDATLVIRPDGTNSPFDKDKLIKSLSPMNIGLDKQHVVLPTIVEKVALSLPQEITIEELVTLVSETLATMSTIHPDHSKLAARVVVRKIQKNVQRTFSDCIGELYEYVNPRNNKHSPLVSKQLLDIVRANKKVIDDSIVPERDMEFDFFGLKTLERSYLLKMHNQVRETPQFLLMRVSLGIHLTDIHAALETYDLMSQRYMIHASPTLFNSGTPQSYLSSCFLVAMQDDSIDGIYKTLHQTALISKASGGIGLHISNIRSTGSYIAGSNGESSGIVPMLRVFNNTARYVDQGGNKRPGAFAVYLEPWHLDIFDFINLRKNHGKEELRARDLFLALWVPDLFMEKVKANEDWHLFSPDEAPGLNEVYGEQFVKLYNSYVAEGRAIEVVKAQKLWHAILEAQTETGGPFILYKDACNRKTNQKNLGVIKSSNLCCEVVQYSSPDEVAVCNLASVGLPRFIKEHGDQVWFDFEKLHRVVKVLARNLNKVIDVCDYPVSEAQRSNFRHRPIAIGVQGLADLFMELSVPFDGEEARELNIGIFETIYHAALEASVELSEKNGPYETFAGSPASEGKLQFDLWGHKPSDRYDWDSLKAQIKVHGLRNSLLVAPMPTASTSQILGFTESFEPLHSNIYTRRVLSGEFQVVNPYLVQDLIALNLWDDQMKNEIIDHDGSIASIRAIPASLKALYKTTWEISQRTIIDMAADRGPFIDQSQSMNIHLADPTMGKLNSMHFYGWSKGLKTGMYYLRTKAASAAIKFTIDRSVTPVERKAKGNVKRRIYAPFAMKKMKLNDLGSSSLVVSDESEGSLGEASEYDIHSETPVSCSIGEQGNCDSCSG